MKKKDCKHKWKVMLKEETAGTLFGYRNYQVTIAVCEKCLLKRYV